MSGNPGAGSDGADANSRSRGTAYAPRPAMRYAMTTPRACGRAQAAWFTALAFLGSSCAAAPHTRPAAAPEAPGTMLARGAAPAVARETARESSMAVQAPADDDAPTDPTGAPRRGTVELMDFIGIGRGERVAELGAGYADSLTRMAAAVGPAGVVYSRHDPRPLTALPSDHGRPPSRSGSLPANVRSMETPSNAPFSAAAHHLNLVTLLFGYHDFGALASERRSLNEAVFRALEPGGVYVIAERVPLPGSTPRAEHEGIEERLVRAEVERAGFRFVRAANLSSSQARPEAASPTRAPDDSYLLQFQKPGGLH